MDVAPATMNRFPAVKRIAIGCAGGAPEKGRVTRRAPLDRFAPLAAWLLLLCPTVCRAHVGSPNVFFEGLAGPHPVRVIIRPPPVLPGLAQVDVRAEGATNVTVRAVLWEAGRDAAPAPLPAPAVAGETNLFNAPLWLLFGGSYSVQVTVRSARGQGVAIVPLNSLATRRPVMSPVVCATLIALGIILLTGAVWLVGAAARDSVLDAGVAPTRRDQTRSRLLAAGAALFFIGAICAGAGRWRTMNREFLNNALSQPLPVVATVRTNGPRSILHLMPPESTGPATTWETLVADHGKLMHLFLAREPDFNAFAHLHPVRRDARSFENILPALPAGSYQLYAEVTHENGLNQTLTARVVLPAPTGRVPQMAGGTNRMGEVFCQSPIPPAGNAPEPFALDADDSWHTGAVSSDPSTDRTRISRLMGGMNMVFQNAGELIENREISLRFALLNPEGQPAPLQPYMGMRGHAVVRRADGEVFTHLHPVGTISMAAQELFTRREGSDPPPSNAETNSLPTVSEGAAGNWNANNEVSFPYAFPRPGDYRLWVQVRTSGRVLTGVFDVAIKPSR
jgi:hypothetical protein